MAPPGRRPRRSRCRPGRVFLDAAGDDPERPVRKRPLQLQGLVRRGRHPGLDFVRRRQDHRHRLRVDGADLGVRLRREEREDVVGGLALLDLPTEVQLVQMPAKQARGRLSSKANQMSPPSALLNSLKELNGTTQRFSTPSHLVQCLLFTLRMLVVPPSGSIRSSSVKSTVFLSPCSFSARRCRAANSASAASSCSAMAAAAPRATQRTGEMVPDRIPRSCPPPNKIGSGIIGHSSDKYSAPMPTGAYTCARTRTRRDRPREPYQRRSEFLADGLRRVGMEDDAVQLTDGGNFGDGLQNADFMLADHDRNERGVVPYDGTQALNIEPGLKNLRWGHLNTRTLPTEEADSLKDA